MAVPASASSPGALPSAKAQRRLQGSVPDKTLRSAAPQLLVGFSFSHPLLERPASTLLNDLVGELWDRAAGSRD